jgi:hypothetical protein
VAGWAKTCEVMQNEKIPANNISATFFCFDFINFKLLS